jgi:hypothetical protein
MSYVSDSLPGSKFDIAGDKVFFAGHHVATVEKNLPTEVAESFEYALLNAADDAARHSHFAGYYTAIFEIARLRPQSLRALKEILGPHVTAILLNGRTVRR